MAAGHLKRSATTGHLLHNASGHLVNECGSGCEDGLADSYVVTYTVVRYNSNNCTGTPACNDTDAVTVTRSDCTQSWTGSGSVCAGQTNVVLASGGPGFVVSITVLSAIPPVHTGTLAGSSPVGTYTVTSGCQVDSLPIPPITSEICTAISVA